MYSDKGFTCGALAVFMCAVVMTAYMLSGESPSASDDGHTEGRQTRNLGDSVMAGADSVTNISYDENELLCEAFACGDIDGAYLFDYLYDGE